MRGHDPPKRAVTIPKSLVTIGRNTHETVEEAVANLREASELYLEELPLKSTGQPLVTTFQVTVNA